MVNLLFDHLITTPSFDGMVRLLFLLDEILGLSHSHHIGWSIWLIHFLTTYLLFLLNEILRFASLLPHWMGYMVNPLPDLLITTGRLMGVVRLLILFNKVLGLSQSHNNEWAIWSICFLRDPYVKQGCLASLVLVGYIILYHYNLFFFT